MESCPLIGQRRALPRLSAIVLGHESPDLVRFLSDCEGDRRGGVASCGVRLLRGQGF